MADTPVTGQQVQELSGRLEGLNETMVSVYDRMAELDHTIGSLVEELRTIKTLIGPLSTEVYYRQQETK